VFWLPRLRKGRSITDAGNGTQRRNNDGKQRLVTLSSIQSGDVIAFYCIFLNRGVLSDKVLIDCNNRKTPEGYAI